MNGLVWVTATAFAAGVINAVAGGGTFLTFPALTYFGQLSQQLANMTSTVGLWPGSASSVVAAWKDFPSIARSILIPFSIISLVGGWIGAEILIKTSPQSFELVIPWLLAFATVVFAFSKPIARWAGRGHGQRTPGWTLLVAAIQLVIAIYGGYFGAGIGVLMLAGLSFAGLESIHQMNALKVLLATLINAVAAVVFILIGQKVSWPIALAMAIASTVGGFIGMAAARKVQPDSLRAVILVIGVGLTIVYFARNYFHAF